VLLDVRAFYPSIDRTILRALLSRRLRERPLLELLGVLVESGAGIYRRLGVGEALGFPPGFPPAGCGLPIGNLTSQLFANHYLAGLDDLLARRLRVPHAQRYMDDVSLFGDDPLALAAARDAAAGAPARR